MTSNLRAETIYFDSFDGESVEAYLATTEADEKVGGVVVIHHFPGYDEATKEIVRKFAANGYNAICVNLYYRESPDASPDDAAAAARAAGRGAGRATRRRRRRGGQLLARVGELESEGRRHRLLLGRTSVGARRVQPATSKPRSTATAPSSSWTRPRRRA